MLDHDGKGRTPEERREATLKTGIILVCLGVGLALAAYVLQNIVTETFVPRRLGGTLYIAAPVVGFIGLGNLLFHALSRRGSTGIRPG
jgi:hypothetical protein